MSNEIRGYDNNGRPTMKLENAKIIVYEAGTQKGGDGTLEALILCVRELRREIDELMRKERGHK